MPSMKFKFKILATIFLFLGTAGCAQVLEPFKIIWGSSTRALEEARAEALSKTYSCDFDACYDEVLKIAKETKYVVFVNDRLRERIVVLGIPGNVDTTEVGIFFSELKDAAIKIDVSSLSSTAKEKAAHVIFEGLDTKFKEQK